MVEREEAYVDPQAEEDFDKIDKKATFTKAVDKYAPWMTDQMAEFEAVDAARYAMRKGDGDVRSGDQREQELSGAGLKAKRMDDEVALSWFTSTEDDNIGFEIQRRPGGAEDWSAVANFEEFGALRSQGNNGGMYSFVDSSVTPGTWIYRVMDCSQDGEKSLLSQCMVEIPTERDEKVNMIAVSVIAVLGLAAVAGGYLIDPQ